MTIIDGRIHFALAQRAAICKRLEAKGHVTLTPAPDYLAFDGALLDAEADLREAMRTGLRSDLEPSPR